MTDHNDEEVEVLAERLFSKSGRTDYVWGSRLRENRYDDTPQQLPKVEKDKYRDMARKKLGL